MLFAFRLFLVAFIVTSAIAAANITIVLVDMKVIDNDLKSLTSQTDAYNGTGPESVRIIDSFGKLRQDILKAMSDYQPIPTPTEADAKKVTDYVYNPIFLDLRTFVAALKRKKDVFVGGGMRNTILSYLDSTKDAADKFLDVVITKCPTRNLQLNAVNTKQAIDNALGDAINYYHS